MLPVKLPYYANTQVLMTETKLGVQEISIPKIYDTPIPGKTFWRVDCLSAIYGELPPVFELNRDVLYRLIAGYEEDLDILVALYRSQPEIRKRLNDLYIYGDQSKTVAESYLMPLRKTVEDFRCMVLDRMKVTHNKYLVQTHYYIYYGVWNRNEIPEEYGGVFIC